MLLRVLLKEEGGTWVAQCLDYDIAAQASSIGEAKRRFERTLIAQAEADIRRHRQLFEGIGRAPERYFQEYHNAGFREVRFVELPVLEVEHVVTPANSIQEEFRLAA